MIRRHGRPGRQQHFSGRFPATQAELDRIQSAAGNSFKDDIFSNSTDGWSLSASINDALAAVGDVRANYVPIGGTTGLGITTSHIFSGP